MYRILPIFIWVVCSSAIIPLAFALPLIAHQEKTSASVGATIHLEPNDSPYARKPTLTWFMLTRRGGAMLSPSTCNCRVAVYDSRQQAIAHHLPLSTMAMEGHKKGHEAIRHDDHVSQSGCLYSRSRWTSHEIKALNPLNSSFQ